MPVSTLIPPTTASQRPVLNHNTLEQRLDHLNSTISQLDSTISLLSTQLSTILVSRHPQQAHNPPRDLPKIHQLYRPKRFLSYLSQKDITSLLGSYNAPTQSAPFSPATSDNTTHYIQIIPLTSSRPQTYPNPAHEQKLPSKNIIKPNLQGILIYHK